MKLLDASLSLGEMELILERELTDNQDDIRIVGDLELSYEDYKCLALKLKGIKKYKDNIKVYNKYKLCGIVVWIFALRFEKEDKIDFTVVKQMLESLPQHQLRYVLNLFALTFTDSGLDDFDIDTRSLDGFFAIAATHAGIPDELLDTLCRLFEDSIMHQDIRMLERQVINHLSPRMTEIFKYIDSERQRKMIQIFRQMFVDIRINQLSREEVFCKYPRVSKRMIEGCMRWCEEYEEKSELILSVR